MSTSPPPSRLPAPLLSSDEMVNDLCVALLAHEASVRGVHADATRTTQYELELTMRKIARCEGWLRMLGRHVTLAHVRARLPEPEPATDIAQPPSRVGLDGDGGRALSAQDLPTRAVPRPAIAGHRSDVLRAQRLRTAPHAGPEVRPESLAVDG
jgi:hypothetical protein